MQVTSHAGLYCPRHVTGPLGPNSLTPETFISLPVLARLQVPAHINTPPPPCLANTYHSFVAVICLPVWQRMTHVDLSSTKLLSSNGSRRLQWVLLRCHRHSAKGPTLRWRKGMQVRSARSAKQRIVEVHCQYDKQHLFRTEGEVVLRRQPSQPGIAPRVNRFRQQPSGCRYSLRHKRWRAKRRVCEYLINNRYYGFRRYELLRQEWHWGFIGSLQIRSSIHRVVESMLAARHHTPDHTKC